MAIVTPYDPHRFKTAAAHYAGREPYSPRLIARVAELTGLTADDRVMDLGSGPGTLALAMAPYVGSVVAVDPEAEMLALAEAAAGDVRPRLTLIEGSSNDLGPHFGMFALVAIGRAFHWMDRADTLRRLDEIVEPDGALVLFDVATVRSPDTAWIRDYRDIIEKFADGAATWHGPDVLPHEAVLLDSPFSRLECIATIERRRVKVDSLIDRALSMSRTSPGRIGPEKAAALAEEIRALGERATTDGSLTEILASNALIARRPRVTN